MTPKELRLHALKVAAEEVGVKEATGRNDGTPAQRYLEGDTGLAWCAAFVLWAFRRAGVNFPGNRWANRAVRRLWNELNNAGATFTLDVRGSVEGESGSEAGGAAASGGPRGNAPELGRGLRGVSAEVPRDRGPEDCDCCTGESCICSGLPQAREGSPPSAGSAQCGHGHPDGVCPHPKVVRADAGPAGDVQGQLFPVPQGGLHPQIGEVAELQWVRASPDDVWGSVGRPTLDSGNDRRHYLRSPRAESFGTGERLQPGYEWELGAEAPGAQRLPDALPHAVEPGDLIFLNSRGDSDTGPGWHIGIVEVVSPDGTIRSIDGNWANRVSRVSRPWDHPGIVGFARWPRDGGSDA